MWKAEFWEIPPPPEISSDTVQVSAQISLWPHAPPQDRFHFDPVLTYIVTCVIGVAWSLISAFSKLLTQISIHRVKQTMLRKGGGQIFQKKKSFLNNLCLGRVLSLMDHIGAVHTGGYRFFLRRSRRANDDEALHFSWNFVKKDGLRRFIGKI